VKKLLLLTMLCACLPRAGGECAADADCAGGPAGSFCAERICQGPLQGSLEALPSRVFGRGETLHVRLHVLRAHGVASARVLVAGQAVEAAPELDGALGAQVPLALVPAGAEGPVPLSAELRDDLGHSVAFPASAIVDGRAPRIAFDAITSAAVVRGTRLSLRITAQDLTAVSIEGATPNPDGSFSLPVDTSTAPAGASAMTVTANAVDAAGNRATIDARVALTRVKFSAVHPTALPVNGFVLTDSRIYALAGQNEFWFLDRAGGSQLVRPTTTGIVFPHLATDGSRLFFGRSDDNMVCRLLPTGVLEACAGPYAPLTDGPILSGAMAVVSAGGDGNDFWSQRLVAIPDAVPPKSPIVTPQTTIFLAAPSIAPDGTIYASSSSGTMAARFDGSSWSTPQPALQWPILYFVQPTFRDANTILFPETGGFDTFAIPAPGKITNTSVRKSIDLTAGVAFAPTIAADGTVLVAYDKSLYATAPDGSIRWSRIFHDDQLTAPPAAGAGGILYAGMQSGQILAISVADGSTIWSYDGTSRILGSLAPGCDGVLYAGTTAGIVALVMDAPGLANSTWPKAGHDVRGTGDARRPMRSATGSCLE
jgi:hypothetical protein